MNRRELLRELGLAIGAVTFAPQLIATQSKHFLDSFSGVYSFPENVAPYAGRFVTPQWIVAETLREITLNEKLKDRKFIHVDKGVNGIGSALMMGGVYTRVGSKEGVFDTQISGNFQFSEEDWKMSLDEFREKYLTPCAAQIANELAAREHLKYCGKLVLPQALESAVQVTDSFSGLDLRFLRAYDVVCNRFINRFDVLLG